MGVLLKSGPEGIDSAITSISDVEPDQGKTAYRGYDIHDLVEQSTFEEVAFLLLYGRLPQREELTAFLKDLYGNRDLPKELLRIFHNLPARSHPMDTLHAAVAFLGVIDPEARDLSREALFRKAIRTIAQLPTVIAMNWRIHLGQQPVSPNKRLSHTQNFLYMLSGYTPDEDAVTALDRLFILCAEHEFDVSSLTARITVSSRTDYHSAIAAAIASLKGRLQGGECEQAMRMIQGARQTALKEEEIAQAINKNRHSIGFDRPSGKHGNVCAQAMKRVSKQLGEKTGDLSWHNLCETIEAFMLREKGLCHNTGFYIAPILTLLSMPTDLCTSVLAAGRIAGWTAHIFEQLDNNRVMKPHFTYRGPKNLSYQPLSGRNSRAQS